MATGTDSGSVLFSAPVLQFLQNAIGGTVDQNTGSTGSSTSQQSSNQNTSQTGGSQTSGTSSQTTQSSANVADLQKILEQQMSGISPEMLQAIFTEGSKAAPGLVNATANAVGARSSNNTPLATALTQLSSSLTGKAAELSLDQRNKAAQTAAQIAELTKSTTTSGSTSGNTTNTTNSTSTGSTGTTQTSDQQTNVQTDSQPNYGNAAKLIAMLAASGALGEGGSLSGLASGLSGGSSALLGGLAAGGSGIADWFKSLFGGSASGTPTVGLDPTTQPGVDPNAPAGDGQQPTADEMQSFLDNYLANTPQLQDLLGSLQLDPNSLPAVAPQVPNLEPVTPIPDPTPDWWSSEGWDSIDWANLEP